MGLFSRMTTVVKAKLNTILDRAEDPREVLEYSYEKQVELLRKVKQGVVEVVASRRRLELQAAKLRDSASRLEAQARQALAMGREDLARMALERKQAVLLELQGLDQQLADLEKEQERLTVAEQRLQAKVEAFRTRKEIIKAQYTAAQAQVKIGEALSGVSEEMADVGLAIQRAEEKTERMRARASAIDELAATGVLEDLTARDDVVERELAKLTAAQNVELELEEMKRQLGAPSRPKELEPGGAT